MKCSEKWVYEMNYRAAIITIDSYNYGNRLQNLAVQVLLSSYRMHVNTFKRRSNQLNKKNIKNIIKITAGFLNKILGIRQTRLLEYNRLYRFYKFNKNYINWDKRTLEAVCHTNYIDKHYDILITGSDQIWNYKFPFNSKLNLLAFGSDKLKRAALSASIGNIELTEEEKILFSKNLPRFDAVSVREDSANAILRFIRDDIVTLLDPTMLVDESYWKKKLKKTKLKIPRSYVFVYFLGDMESKIYKFIDKVCAESSLLIVDVNDIKNPYYGVDPIDFIKLIDSSEYIFTDSFHCSVFSILFEKKFSVYDRFGSQMHVSIRTDELLHKFDILDRKNIFEISKMEQVDYSKKELILEQERKRADLFIRSVLADSY